MAAGALALITSLSLLTLSYYPEAFYHQLGCEGSVHTVGSLFGACLCLRRTALS